MKIIVGGAGSVGASIIGYLSQGNNEITVVDKDAKRLEEISKTWDIRPIQGSISHPSILSLAGASGADLLLSLTDKDEVNIVACQLAQTLFDVPEKIARLDNDDFFNPDWSGLYGDINTPIDLIISPDFSIAESIYNRLKLPGALEHNLFLENKVVLVGLQCNAKNPLIKTPLSQLSLLAPELVVSFLCIVRNGLPFVPKEEDILDTGDKVYFLVEKSKLFDAIHAFDMDFPVAEKVVIFGGNQISAHLAKKIEKDDNITSCKIVEEDLKSAQILAKKMNSISVIHGDLLNDAIIQEAGLEKADAVISTTESDKDNMLVSMLAQKLGVQNAISLINSKQYTNFINEGSQILVDRASITISKILKKIRKINLRKAYCLEKNTGEIWETTITENSKVLGKKVANIKLPAQCKIGIIARKDEIIIPTGEEELLLGDVVIVYVSSTSIKKAEKLFS